MDGAIRFSLNARENSIDVSLHRRDDSAPAFTRTTHCDLRYHRDAPRQEQTPEDLAEALTNLAGAIEGHDEACLTLSASSSPQDQKTPGDPHWSVTVLAILLIVVAGMLLERLRAGGRLPRPGQLYVAALTAVTLVGLLLRIQDLGAPFVNGLATERIELAARPLWQILTLVQGDSRHPPMTSIILHALLWFGQEEWLLRLPFAILSALSIPLAAVVTRGTSRESAALVAATTCAVSVPLALSWQPIGSHTVFPLAFCLMVLAYRTLLDDPCPRRSIWLAVVNVICVWTHYVCVVPLLFQSVGLRRGPEVRTNLGRALMLSLLGGLLPLGHMLESLYSDLARRGSSQEGWTTGAWVADMFHGQATWHGIAWPIFLAVLALPGAAVLARDAWIRRGRAGDLHLVLSALTVVAILLVLSQLAFMQARHLIIAIVPLTIVAAAGTCRCFDAAAKRVRRPWQTWFISSSRWIAYAMILLPVVSPLLARGDAVEDASTMAEIPPLTRIIAAGDPTTVVLVDPAHREHVGFYLTDRVLPLDEIQRGRGQYGYGRFRLFILEERARGSKHRADLERILRDLMMEHPRLWLLDTGGGGATWPALERAGRCSLEQHTGSVRLMMCAVSTGEGSFSSGLHL